MTVPDLAEQNIESWRKVVAAYEHSAAMPEGDWLIPLLHFVKQTASSEQAKLFRAGRSLWSLIISTAAQHGLDDDEPFVAVTMDRYSKDHPIQVEYWSSLRSLAEGQVCEEKDISATLTPLLTRLWNETRGKTTSH